MYLETHSLESSLPFISEEIEVFWVEVVDRVTNEIITDVFCGSDEEMAKTQKDRLDLAWDDGSTYTSITSDWMTEDELNEQ